MLIRVPNNQLLNPDEVRRMFYRTEIVWTGFKSEEQVIWYSIIVKYVDGSQETIFTTKKLHEAENFIIDFYSQVEGDNNANRTN